MAVHIREGDWLAHRPLHECQLGDEGVLVLGIYRSDGSYVGAPSRQTEVESGDTLILYGRSDALRELDRRRAGASGEQAHAEAVDEQKREVARQEETDSRRERRAEQHP